MFILSHFHNAYLEWESLDQTARLPSSWLRSYLAHFCGPNSRDLILRSRFQQADHINDLTFTVLQHNVGLIEFEGPSSGEPVVSIYLASLVLHCTFNLGRAEGRAASHPVYCFGLRQGESSKMQNVVGRDTAPLQFCEFVASAPFSLWCYKSHARVSRLFA